VVLDMARAALATRYREVYTFTWGDPSTVLSADAGRGLEILLIGLLPEKRFPLRAGFAPFILRNGVPIGYADAYGLCERMEVSFNIFYGFRDGESAFCFARLLKLYHQALRIDCLLHRPPTRSAWETTKRLRPAHPGSIANSDSARRIRSSRGLPVTKKPAFRSSRVIEAPSGR